MVALTMVNHPGGACEARCNSRVARRSFWSVWSFALESQTALGW